MHQLELKIPPALIVFIFAVLMWLTSLWLPKFDLANNLRVYGCSIFFLLGIVLGLLGIGYFVKHNTTIDPTKPDTSSKLVTSGIYKITRNPMYLGLLSLLVGLCFYFSSFYCFILIIGFIRYMNRFQIYPEEKTLEKIFGEDYIQYKKRVRRWL